MHPLLVAQATVVSLHTLLPPRKATTADEKLVVDAIRGLHRWATPDERQVPTRLRRRRSVLLRIRIRSSSLLETVPISKRRERRDVRPCRHRDSVKARLTSSVVGPSFPERQYPSLNDNEAEKVSQPCSSGNSSGQVANLSDISTEPPEGWPKLSEIASPIIQVHPLEAETEKNLFCEKTFAGAQLASKETGEHDVSAPLTTRRGEIKAPSDLPIYTAPSSPAKALAKRQRISSACFCREAGSKACTAADELPALSHGSTRGADSPSNSVGIMEATRSVPNTQVPNREKYRRSRRKNTVPRRRRPGSTPASSGPPGLNLKERVELDQATSFEDSPTPKFDNDPAVQSQSAILMSCDVGSESPASPVTQKSREQDADCHSVEGHEPANSPGSVVIGSSSYDGSSIDMGCGRSSRTHDDIPSRPSSVVWNDSHEESIEEPSPDDQQVRPVDVIRETEDGLQSELCAPRRSPPQSKSTGNQKESPTLADKHPLEQRREKLDHLHGQTASTVTPERLKRNSQLNRSDNATTDPVLWPTSNANSSKRFNTMTLSVSGPVIQDEDLNNPNSNPSNGISPVSQEDHDLRDEICPKFAGQGNNSKLLVGANLDEMNVCIASFQKEIEVELAQELVMRLGGEVVSDFNTALPHCVVAPIDVQTKEVTNSDMIVLLALASRIPVVGMSWLAHCFKSGFWVDFNNFETPSSKVKPSMGVFRGIAATFEDAFSRKNAKRKCVEYRKNVEKLVKLGDGMVVDTSGITEIARKDKTLRLLVRIAYDFENSTMSTVPQELPDFGIPMCVVSQAWISACLFSGQCPPP